MSAPLWVMVEAAILAGGTRDIVEQRVAELCERDGVPRPDPTAIDACYVQIVDKWLTDAADDDEQVHAYHVRLRKHLYQRAYQLNDFKTCLAIATDLAKLQAQYNRERAIRQQRQRPDARRARALELITGGAS